jgi:Fic-DOC domain mobile mystery protein B
MGLNLEYINGQTPLDDDEKDGLLIQTISTRVELDEFEQQNIEEAVQWVLGRSFKVDIIFTESFLKNLHKRLYNNVWSWAGAFRKTDKNLGIDKWQIPTALKTLCEDAIYWVKNETYPADELALRFKHRIVSIHCFSNGNGRHSRLIADIIINKIYRQDMFTWGSSDLIKKGDSRTKYLAAVWAADKGNINELLKFGRL